MSPVTVGLLGHNGLIGHQVLERLIPLHQSGKIALTVIHRSSANTDNVPADVPKRVLDIGNPDGPEYDAAIAGIQTVVSAVGSPGLPLQASLIPAFKRSKDFVTFVPSEFGTDWDDEEVAGTKVTFLKIKDQIAEQFEAAHIPLTIIKTGMFPDFAFKFPILWNVKANRINVYGDSQKTPIPWSSTPYVAAAIVEVIQRPPSEIAGKTFEAIEEFVTNETITEIFTKVHGKPTELVVFDDKKWEQVRDNENVFVSFGALIVRKIRDNHFHYYEQDRLTVPGWKPAGLEKYVREYL